MSANYPKRQHTLRPKGILAFLIVTVALSVLPIGCAEMAKVNVQERPKQKKEPVGDAYAHTITAQMAYLKGDIDTAKAHIYQALIKDPDSAYLNLFMSSLLKEKGDIEEALLYARRALEINNEYTDAYVQIADLYMVKQDYEKANEYYQKAFNLNPANERVASILLGLLMKQDRPEEALGILDKLIEKRPDLSLARYYRAKVLMDMDRLEEAEETLLDLINSDVNLPNIYLDLLNIYEYKGRYQEAKDLLIQMLETNPNDVRLRERYINICIRLKDEKAIEEQINYLKAQAKLSPSYKRLLGSLFLQTKRFKEAIEVFDDLLNEDPSDDRIRYLLGIGYEGANMRDKALDIFLSFVEDSELYPSSIYEACKLLANEKRYDEALDLLFGNEDKLKNDLQFYVIGSFLLENKEGFDSAKNILLKGLELLGENEELLYRLGIIYDKKNQKSKAIEIMNKILQKNKAHADALNYIGYTYADEGKNLNEALQLIKKALKLKPGSGYIIDSLGWVYFRLGDMEKAKKYLLQAAELEPNDPTIQEHLGELYERLGDKRRALRHYQRSLNLGTPERSKILRAIQRVKGR